MRVGRPIYLWKKKVFQKREVLKIILSFWGFQERMNYVFREKHKIL